MNEEKDMVKKLIIRSRLCMIVILVVAIIIGVSPFIIMWGEKAERYSDEQQVYILVQGIMMLIPTAVSIVCYILSEVFARKVKEKNMPYCIASVLTAVSGMGMSMLFFMGMGGIRNGMSYYGTLLVSAMFMICGIAVFVDTLKIKSILE